MSTVMELAQPLKVLRRLDPGPDLVGVGDTGVVHFEPFKVDAVLERELDMRVVKLQRLAREHSEKSCRCLPMAHW